MQKEENGVQVEYGKSYVFTSSFSSCVTVSEFLLLSSSNIRNWLDLNQTAAAADEPGLNPPFWQKHVFLTVN